MILSLTVIIPELKALSLQMGALGREQSQTTQKARSSLLLTGLRVPLGEGNIGTVNKIPGSIDADLQGIVWALFSVRCTSETEMTTGQELNLAL